MTFIKQSVIYLIFLNCYFKLCVVLKKHFKQQQRQIDKALTATI